MRVVLCCWRVFACFHWSHCGGVEVCSLEPLRRCRGVLMFRGSILMFLGGVGGGRYLRAGRTRRTTGSPKASSTGRGTRRATAPLQREMNPLLLPPDAMAPMVLAFVTAPTILAIVTAPTPVDPSGCASLQSTPRASRRGGAALARYGGGADGAAVWSQDLVRGNSPRHRGVYLGEVTRVDRAGVQARRAPSRAVGITAAAGPSGGGGLADGARGPGCGAGGAAGADQARGRGGV